MTTALHPTRPRRAASELTTFVVLRRPAPSRLAELSITHQGAVRRWALPRGLLVRPLERHLAIELDQPHAPLVQDCGACEIREWTGERVIVVLHGERLRGCFALVRLWSAGPRHWLFLSLRRRPSAPARPTAGETRHEKNPRRRGSFRRDRPGLQRRA